LGGITIGLEGGKGGWGVFSDKSGKNAPWPMSRGGKIAGAQGLKYVQVFRIQELEVT